MTSKIKWMPSQSWLLPVIGLALLLQVGISHKLWLPIHRTLPLVPVFDFLLLGDIFNGILFGGLIIGLLSSILFPKKRWLVGGLLAVLVILFLQDLIRIQAWAYQFFLMLLAIFFIKNQFLRTLTLQIILIATYFWSGLQKINPHFITEVYPWLMSAFDCTSPLGNFPILGYGVGLFESLLGVLLCFAKTKRLGVILITIFHSYILLMLSPLGHNWNLVVLPWNVSMIVLVWLLFWNTPYSPTTKSLTSALPSRNSSFIAFIIWGLVLFGPLLHFFNLWYEPLSMPMYSGVTTELSFECDTDVFQCGIAHQHHMEADRIFAQIIFDDWSMQELKVPIYDMPLVSKTMGTTLCNCLRYPEAGQVHVLRMNRWNKEPHFVQTISCEALVKKSGKKMK